MIKKIKKIIMDNKQVILYLIFGGVTTVVNISIYLIFKNICNINYIISSIIAWIVSVLFAYVTNKKYVFKSNLSTLKELIKELYEFIKYRVFSCLIDIAIMYIMVDLIGINDTISKVISNIVVVIVNYIFSKYIIFVKKESKKKETKKEIIVKYLIYSFLFLTIGMLGLFFVNCIKIKKYDASKTEKVLNDDEIKRIHISVDSINKYKNTFRIEWNCYKIGEKIDSVNSFIVLEDTYNNKMYKVNTDMFKNELLKDVNDFDYSNSSFISVGAYYGLKENVDYKIWVCYGNNYSDKILVDSGKILNIKEESNEY